ncbi:MAG: glycosyltransferase family 4 protein [Acidobacteria bacterium]|nr:glycosyltransferase family 4 protein [Acidobacteriota bacterium]
MFFTRDKYPELRVEVTELILKRLPEYGFSFYWVLQSSGSPKIDEEWDGTHKSLVCAVGGRSFMSIAINHLLDVCNDLWALLFLRKRRYAAILVKDKFLIATLLTLVSMVTSRRLIFWLSFPFPEAWSTSNHNSWTFHLFNRIRGPIARRCLYRFILPRATHVFAQSEKMKQDIIEQGINPQKITAIPMGVPMVDLKLPYPTHNVTKPDNQIWLTYLGTLSKLRRLDILIHGIALSNPKPNMKFLLIGDSQDIRHTRELESLVNELNLQQTVIFKGFMDRPIAWSYVSQSDLCFSPYDTNPVLASTSPTKLIEYMALEKPVIATEHPEQRAIIQKSGAGYLVPYEANALAEVINIALKDPEVLRSKGKQGRAWVTKNRDYSTIADDLAICLQRIVS